MSDLINTYRLSDAAISKMMAAATAKANEIKTPLGIAIVDAGGILRAWVLMNGATPLAFEAATKKARTAAFTGVPTGAVPAEIADRLITTISDFTNLPGGFPIKKDGQTIGAVAGSGGSHEADSGAAQAAIAALGDSIG